MYIYRQMLEQNQDGLISNSEGRMVHRCPHIGGGRGQRLSTLRFILEGAEVLTVLITYSTLPLFYAGRGHSFVVGR